MRRLSAHERALWARVAASVKPLPGRDMPAAPVAALQAVSAAAAAPAPAKAAPRPTAPRPSQPPPAPKPHPLGAPLDGTWDRQISRGRLTPDRIIDLHGHTLADAHARLAAAITAADGTRVLLVITGKGRPDRPSRIRAELIHWLDQGQFRAAIASVRAAHPRHGGAGAFYVILKRAK